MNNVTRDGRFDWARVIRVPAAADVVADYALQSGDILFNNTNSTELVGKTAVFSGYSETIVFSNHFTRIRVDPSQADAEYVGAYLNLLWAKGYFAEICNRWIGQSAIKWEKLKAVEVPLPSLADQLRIMACIRRELTEVDRARKALADQLAALDRYPAALLREAFAGRL